MARGHRLSRGHSRRMFNHGANRVHKRNLGVAAGYVRRGGGRL